MLEAVCVEARLFLYKFWSVFDAREDHFYVDQTL